MSRTKKEERELVRGYGLLVEGECRFPTEHFLGCVCVVLGHSELEGEDIVHSGARSDSLPRLQMEVLRFLEGRRPLLYDFPQCDYPLEALRDRRAGDQRGALERVLVVAGDASEPASDDGGEVPRPPEFDFIDVVKKVDVVDFV